MSCKLSLKDNSLPLTPTSSQQRVSYLPGNLEQKEGWEGSRCVCAFTLGKAPPIWTQQSSEEAPRLLCIPYHYRAKFRCLFPLCTQGGDQRPGCGGNFLTMQQSSDWSFQDRWCRGMRKGLSCKALLFPFYSDVFWVSSSYFETLPHNNRSSESDIS